MITLIDLTPAHFLHVPTPYVMIICTFNDLRSGVVVYFDDIYGIVYHICLGYPFKSIYYNELVVLLLIHDLSLGL